MRPSAAFATLAAALCAGPVLAEGGPKAAEIDAFVAAVKAAGCVVTAQNSEAVIAASGLSAEKAAAVVQRMEDQGQIVRGKDKTLTLAAELCQ